ncbi:hypothetical protein J8N05_37710 [Streptomyces sp. BH-SS-21]|uniref:Uncharacterized protein n=1 Tax=Streptomyces liliiviolaceus TaxID=2823109 RepID=A0A940Y1F3_9ACTN|nr:hypothetical protein [Streptomyces liliiviolaceus]MBQ0853906.1 hypothetical protein [Streptomyces liliiviolaceus]
MARQHVSGFEVLGMSEDPTPGDPDEIGRLAGRYRDIGEKAEVAARHLSEGGAVEKGTGDAMTALQNKLQDLPGKMRRTQKSFLTAAEAYKTYAAALTESQAMVDRAMNEAQAVANTANRVLPELPTDPTPEQRTAATQQRDRVAAAQDELNSAKRLAEDARALRQAASSRAEDTLDEAAGAAIPERDFFKKVADFFQDFPFVQILLSIVIAVTSIFFPVVGFLLGLGTFIFNQIVAGQTGALKLGDLLIGLVALIPGAAVFKVGGAALTRVAPALSKQLGGLVTRAGGSFTRFKEAFAATRVGGALLGSATVRIGGEVVGKFAVGVVTEVVVKAANRDKITAGNVLAGAAASAGLGGLIRGGGALRNRGGRPAPGATAPDAPSAAPPATPPATPPVAVPPVTPRTTPRPLDTVPAAPAGPAPKLSLGERFKAGLKDQAAELVPAGAESAAKVGVAVGEGTPLNEALAGEAANLVPKSPGPAAHRGLEARADRLLGGRTPSEPGPSVPSSPPPAAPPPPPASPLPPSPPPSPRPSVSDGGLPTDRPASPDGFATAPSSPTKDGFVTAPSSPTTDGFTTAPSSPTTDRFTTPPPSPTDDGFTTAPSSPVTDSPVTDRPEPSDA